jgi:hypothetical protein
LSRPCLRTIRHGRRRRPRGRGGGSSSITAPRTPDRPPRSTPSTATAATGTNWATIGNGGGSGDGAIEVGSRWPKQKWGAHCRVGDNEEYNYFGIGICLVGNFDKQRPSETQMQSLARLVAYLAARYHVDNAHIIGHGSVGDTRCPGRGFPMGDLQARVMRARVPRDDLAQ